MGFYFIQGGGIANRTWLKDSSKEENQKEIHIWTMEDWQPNPGELRCQVPLLFRRFSPINNIIPIKSDFN